MHFFVTGHTGFKGSWLILLLRELGHSVSGFSIDIPKGGLFERANLAKLTAQHIIGDVRDKRALLSAVAFAKPDAAIHLAAQPLVLRSFREPEATVTTNVNGTLNFLLATHENSIPVSLVVTTDKVYLDTGKGKYKESDALGGWDPYSASKAMADILAQSWSNLAGSGRVVIARAGNVIGAFDSSEDRLIPDINRAIHQKSKLTVRNPQMVRPWQHVLDCLSGYLKYVELASTTPRAVPHILNFGPDNDHFRSVIDVVHSANQVKSLEYRFSDSQSPGGKETSLLTLDTSLARHLLDWENKISFDEAVKMSIETDNQGSALEISLGQIREFLRRR